MNENQELAVIWEDYARTKERLEAARTAGDWPAVLEATGEMHALMEQIQNHPQP